MVLIWAVGCPGGGAPTDRPHGQQTRQETNHRLVMSLPNVTQEGMSIRPKACISFLEDIIDYIYSFYIGHYRRTSKLLLKMTRKSKVVNTHNHKHYHITPNIPSQHCHGNGCNNKRIHKYYAIGHKFPKQQNLLVMKVLIVRVKPRLQLLLCLHAQYRR
jgi:hypothetical protein